MSIALLILLPILLSGYNFAKFWNGSRYTVMREEGYHLYFRTAYYGSIFVLIGFAIFLIFPSGSFSYVVSTREVFDEAFRSSRLPIFNLFSVAILSMAVCWFFVNLFNWIIPEEYYYKQAIKNDDFELLLYRAMEKEKTISVTMANKKVYVGWVVRAFDPDSERKDLRLLPLASGIRSEETGKVTFTTFYKSITDAIKNPTDNTLPGHIEVEDMEVVLPISEIQSSNLFAFETYLKFQ